MISLPFDTGLYISQNRGLLQTVFRIFAPSSLTHTLRTVALLCFYRWIGLFFYEMDAIAIFCLHDHIHSFIMSFFPWHPLFEHICFNIFSHWFPRQRDREGENGRYRDEEKSSILWITPQMPATPRADLGQHRRQKVHPSLLRGWQWANYLTLGIQQEM